MLCPYCNNDTKVLESRLTDDAMRRRRECFTCANRFTTYEKAVFNLTVVKKDGRVQPFDIQKVSCSIQRALGKVNEETIKIVTRKVEQKVLRKKVNSIKTTSIGRLVLQELKKTDKIAYLRFATVHKSIEDPKMLEKELQIIY